LPGPSPTLSPTDPVPRGLLTLWARAGMCVCIYVCMCTRARVHMQPVCCVSLTCEHLWQLFIRCAMTLGAGGGGGGDGAQGGDAGRGERRRTSPCWVLAPPGQGVDRFAGRGGEVGSRARGGGGGGGGRDADGGGGKDGRGDRSVQLGSLRGAGIGTLVRV